MEQKNIGKFISKLRKEKELTQEELFNNGEIINLKQSNKEELDRTSQFYCNQN